MTFPRFKKKTVQNKNKHTLRRLVRCSERHLNAAHCNQEPGCSGKSGAKAKKAAAAPSDQVQLTQKDISIILIDLSMKELYNGGDKQELRLVEDILEPNNIQFSDEQSLESYWDIITHSGFVKPSIGFGNNGKVSLSKAGFDVMNQYGSYVAFLQAQQQAQSGGAVPNPQVQQQVPPNVPPPVSDKSDDEEQEEYYDG